jgi:hypothetical protein
MAAPSEVAGMVYGLRVLYPLRSGDGCLPVCPMGGRAGDAGIWDWTRLGVLSPFFQGLRLQALTLLMGMRGRTRRPCNAIVSTLYSYHMKRKLKAMSESTTVLNDFERLMDEVCDSTTHLLGQTRRLRMELQEFNAADRQYMVLKYPFILQNPDSYET